MKSNWEQIQVIKEPYFMQYLGSNSTMIGCSPSKIKFHESSPGLPSRILADDIQCLLSGCLIRMIDLVKLNHVFFQILGKQNGPTRCY